MGTRMTGAAPAMKRFLPLLAVATADSASAATSLCLPGMPDCVGGDMGLMWVPVVVGLQLAHLYYLQGGPGAFLARFVGGNGPLTGQGWGLLQVGIPIAMVLAFPPLIGLTLLGKAFGPVGVLHLLAVQGGYWLWLRRWLRKIDAAAAETADDAAAAAVPEAPPPPPEIAVPPLRRGPLDGPLMVESIGLPSGRFQAGSGAPLPLPPLAQPIFAAGPAVPPAPPVSPVRSVGAVSSLPRPQSVYGTSRPPRAPEESAPPRSGHADVRALIDRLTKLYMWDDVGVDEPFRSSRKRSVAKLFTGEDEARLGEALVAAMRSVARHTVVLYRCGVGDESLEDILAAHPVEGFDEYAADVMQRLVYSALLDRQKLFVDPMDLEIFGEEFIDALYRLALLDVRGTIACHPGVAQAAVHLSLQ